MRERDRDIHEILTSSSQFSLELLSTLQSLGQRLRRARLERNETQEVFATRLGVSVPTLRSMERGEPGVRIGIWAKALWLLDRLEELERVLRRRDSLFERWEGQDLPTRQRASRRKDSDERR